MNMEKRKTDKVKYLDEIIMYNGYRKGSTQARIQMMELVYGPIISTRRCR